jgi:hypothetical protein
MRYRQLCLLIKLYLIYSFVEQFFILIIIDTFEDAKLKEKELFLSASESESPEKKKKKKNLIQHKLLKKVTVVSHMILIFQNW